MAGLASGIAGPATGDMPFSWDRPAVADKTNVAKKMRVSSTTKPVLRPGFVGPWSWWRFIHDRVQFTPRKVHIKCGKLEAAGRLARIYAVS